MKTELMLGIALTTAALIGGWLVVRHKTSAHHPILRVLLTLIVGYVLVNVLAILGAPFALLYKSAGAMHATMIVMGWLLAGAGKTLVQVMYDSRTPRHRNFIQAMSDAIGGSTTKFIVSIILVVVGVQVASHLGVTGEQGWPMLAAGCFSAFLPLFPTRTVARLFEHRAPRFA